jgi:hypothetical protein
MIEERRDHRFRSGTAGINDEESPSGDGERFSLEATFNQRRAWIHYTA